MTDPKDHPEQDPAEGSRETIERDLKRQDEKRRGDKRPPAKTYRRPGKLVQRRPNHRRGVEAGSKARAIWV